MARKTQKYTLSKEQQKLAADNLNLARREAWRLQRTTDIDYDTLEGAALEGLCKAAYRYNPESGFKFSSLAVPTIRGELLHWIRDRTYAVRLTHKMRENWLKGRKLLYEGLTDSQICEKLNIDISEWQDIVSVCSGPPLEINEQAKPTECLEPDEIDFASQHLRIAEEMYLTADEEKRTLIDGYFSGSNTRGSVHAVKQILRNITQAWDLQDPKTRLG